MRALDILETVLRHTVDAPYTVEEWHDISDATVEILGAYRIEEGTIEDQIIIGLKTYFVIKTVVTSVQTDEDGWLRYSAVLQRRPAFARVPLEVAR